MFVNEYNMLLLLDGKLEIGSHVWNNLDYFITLRHLFGSRAVKNLFFCLHKIPIFNHKCATCYELPCNTKKYQKLQGVLITCVEGERGDGEDGERVNGGAGEPQHQGLQVAHLVTLPLVKTRGS